jgi:hypothetical protein
LTNVDIAARYAAADQRQGIYARTARLFAGCAGCREKRGRK